RGAVQRQGKVREEPQRAEVGIDPILSAHARRLHFRDPAKRAGEASHIVAASPLVGESIHEPPLRPRVLKAPLHVSPMLTRVYLQLHPEGLQETAYLILAESLQVLQRLL